MAATDDIETMAKSMSAHFKTLPQQTPTFEKDFIDVSRGVMRLIAEPLVNDIGLKGKVTEPVKLLDSACGAGVVTQEVQAALPDEILRLSSFTCSDSSPAMVDVVKKRIVNEKWVNAEAKVLDAMVSNMRVCLDIWFMRLILYMLRRTLAFRRAHSPMWRLLWDFTSSQTQMPL